MPTLRAGLLGARMRRALFAISAAVMGVMPARAEVLSFRALAPCNWE